MTGIEPAPLTVTGWNLNHLTSYLFGGPEGNRTPTYAVTVRYPSRWTTGPKFYLILPEAFLNHPILSFRSVFNLKTLPDITVSRKYLHLIVFNTIIVENICTLSPIGELNSCFQIENLTS